MNNQVLEASVRSQGELAVIDLAGEISAPAEEVLNRAYELAMQANPTTIVINFNGVDYINSTGIALILNLLVKAGRSHRRLLAYGVSEHYREIFRITRLADFMRIYQDEATALSAV
ncbi:MAG TPA: STAS domain-containing protein [Anaerolineaceae bacterium]|nr:STAS domain-containing protein [Anaerolineaceae bacterium]